MDARTYQELAARTEADPTRLLQLTSVEMVRLLHAGAGMVTEAGEFWDEIKRHLFYGQPLDRQHLQEEAGDLLWYVALACTALGVDLGEVMAANVRKLQVRFPDKFTEVLAKEENRNRTAEQQAATHPRRTKSRVLALQNSARGCCSRYADNQSCDCLEEADDDSVAKTLKDAACEVCGKPATRFVYDRSPKGKEIEHRFCTEHARRAEPLRD